jgi:predicted dehydrogenase
MSFKIGVIGAGGIAYRRLIPEVFKELKDIEIAAVMDINLAIAEKVGKEFGVKWFDDENDLLDLAYLDAVYIATPQSFHVKSVLNSIAHKKHVLVEKPMSTSIEDDIKMILASETNKVQLGVAYMMRYNVYNLKALEIVKSGKIGKPIMGRAQLTCWFPKMEGNWRQNYDISCGGSLMDMGGHCIDLLTMFFGDVAEVAGFQDNLVHDYYPVEDTSTVILKFKNGTHGIVDNYFSIPDNAAKNRIEVYGSRGSIIGEGTIGQDAEGGRLEVFIQEENNGYVAGQIRNNNAKTIVYDNLNSKGLYAQEVEDFVNAVKAGKSPPIDGYLGMKNDNVTLAIYKAVKTRQVVKI